MIQIQYKLTEKEFLDYNFFTCWKTPEKRNRRLIYYLLTPVLYLIVIGFIFYDSTKGGFDNSSIFIAIIGLILLIAFTRLNIRKGFNKQALRTIKSSPPDSVLSETELIISETGISGKTKVAEVKYSWNAFQKQVIVNDCYYLYTNVRQALVIPTRAFKTILEKESFEKALAQYLPLQSQLPQISR